MKSKPLPATTPLSRLAPITDVRPAAGAAYQRARKAAQTGQVRAVRIGSTWFFDKSDLKKLIEDSK